MLKLLDKNKVGVALLSDVKDLVINRKVKQGECKLSFSLYQGNINTKSISEESYIELQNGERYIVKSITDQKIVIRYACSLDLEELESKIWADGFDTGGKAKVADTVRLAIAGAGWAVEEAQGLDTTLRTLKLDGTNALDVIYKAIAKWDVEVQFYPALRKIRLMNRMGEDKGVYFSDELNMTTFNIDSDSYGFCTRLYVRGKDGLTFSANNGGKDYVENFNYSTKVVSKLWKDERYEDPVQMLADAKLKIADLAKPRVSYGVELTDLSALNDKYSFLSYGIGDTITLLSSQKQFRDTQRILEITEYPLEPERNSAVIANTQMTFEELQKKNEEMSEKVDNAFNEDGTINGNKIDGLPEVDLEIKDGSITTNKLSANSVTTEKLVAGSVTAEKIKAGSIDATHIKAGTITANSAILDNASITTAKIADASITTAKIQDAAIDSAKIDVAQINSAHIQDAAIGTAQIADAAITVAKIQDAFVDNLVANQGKFQSAQIGELEAGNIKAGAITTEKLAAGAVTAGTIAAGAITAGKISAGAITTEKLAANSITSEKIAANAITTDKISANSVDASKITITDYTNYCTIATNSEYVNQSGAMEKALYLKNIGRLDVSKNLTTVNANDKFLVTGKVYVVSETANPTHIYFCWRTVNGTSTGSNTYYNMTGVVGAYTSFSFEIPIKTRPTDASYGTFSVRNGTDGTGEVYIFGLDIKKKSGGELIVDGSITADKIAAGSITADKIATGAITADKVTAGAITADKIGANQITASKIATDAIESRHIKAGTIVAEDISASTISSIEVNASTITANKIASGEIKVGNANIVDGTISGAKISSATITEAQIAKATITDASIKSLNASKITAGTLDASKINVTNLKADSITTGSITVQGENLIHNTAFDRGETYFNTEVQSGIEPQFVGWGSVWKIDTVNKFEGVNTAKASRTGLSADSWNEFRSEEISVVPGETFVASAYFKATGADATNRLIFAIWGYKEDGSRINVTADYPIQADTDYVRVVRSGTVPAGAVHIRWAVSIKRNGTFNVAKPMLSRGSIASEWKPHTDELISDGAIDNDKLGDQAVTSDKLMVDELFVGENAFINSLKAVDIDASQITTGKINSERLDITGLVSFEAFDETLQPIFNVQGDKTYINGGTIATNTIKADKIDLLSGITVKGPDGTNTFAIANDGNVEVNGLLKSGNYIPGNSGYQISPNGTAELNQAIIRGSIDLPNAGITNYGATIGNDNLLENSNFEYSLSGYWQTHDMSSGGTDKAISILTGGEWCPVGYKVLQIRGTNTTNRYGVISKSYTLKPNTEYTISGYCAGHRTGNLQVNVRERGLSDANIHTKSYAPVSGGNTFDKWTRFETTFTTGSTTSYALNLYSQNMGDNGYAWFGQIKLEEGGKATPWCPASIEQFNYTRIWAGTSYAKRDTAPFRVHQDGSLFATDGTFEGKLYGDYNNGYIHIHKDRIEINDAVVPVGGDISMLPLTTGSEYVSIGTGASKFNTNVSMGNNNIEYNNTDKTLILNNTNFEVNGTQASILVDRGSGAFGGLNILGASGGHHILRGSTSNDKLGTLVLDSQGNQGQRGDFSFTRKNYTQKCKVDIDGDLTVSEKVSSTVYPIEQRWMNSNDWKGLGWYVM